MEQITDSINLALAFTLITFAIAKSLQYLEDEQLWTLRLRLSTVEHWVQVPSITITWIILLGTFSIRPSPFISTYGLSFSLICTMGAVITFFEYVLPAYNNRRYVELRWKAWTGPSRTGIRPDLVRYIGDSKDWKTLEESTYGRATERSVEKFASFSFSFRHSFSRQLITIDPTELLLARCAIDQEDSKLWIPQSSIREGVFQPINPDKPASLLWGEDIGFQRRCSRAIISVPRNLLSPWPKIGSGVDARGLCLASGILGRNKGLRPKTLICNLYKKSTIGIFERSSVFWPRPAKTLRSLFHKECVAFFSGLGDDFVAVATELALLLNDAPVSVAIDWLDGQLEHQELQLNNKAHALGATSSELDTLYRGHYAAMLVSLSAHRIGIRIRPEMLVYDAVCKSLDVSQGAWSKSSTMENRRQRESEALGPRVKALINAVI